jgi:hypothetical protein
MLTRKLERFFRVVEEISDSDRDRGGRDGSARDRLLVGIRGISYSILKFSTFFPR